MLIKYEREITFDEQELFKYFEICHEYKKDELEMRIITIIDVVFPIISEHELQECIISTLKNEGIIKLKT